MSRYTTDCLSCIQALETFWFYFPDTNDRNPDSWKGRCLQTLILNMYIICTIIASTSFFFPQLRQLSHGETISWSFCFVFCYLVDCFSVSVQFGGSQSKPEFTVDLKGGTVEWASKDKSSKKHVIEVREGTKSTCRIQFWARPSAPKVWNADKSKRELWECPDLLILN